MSNRRDFLKQTSLASAAVLTSSNLFAFRGTPSDKVVIGVMGTNSRGAFLAKTFANLPNVEIGYICDPDAKVLAKTIADIENRQANNPKASPIFARCWNKKTWTAWQLPRPTIGTRPPPSGVCKQARTFTSKNRAATTRTKAKCWWKQLINTKNSCKWAVNAARSRTSKR